MLDATIDQSSIIKSHIHNNSKELILRKPNKYEKMFYEIKI